MQFTGIHHLTAISARPRDNLAFYTQHLGMRLVKKTVNQDDVSAYHLFYADGEANPGTDLTFFDFPAPPEQRGTNSIARTGLRVSGATTLAYWKARLDMAAIGPVGDIVTVDGHSTLAFEDAEGQRLALIDDGGAGPSAPWAKSPVPPEHQIRGLGPISLDVQHLDRLEPVLTRAMNMRRVRSYTSVDGHDTIVFAMGEGGPAAELHVAERRDLPPARQGAGGVHHVAFRTPDEAQYEAWAARLNELRIPNSGEVDRFYFRSLYFREPNGILFEIATDGPGFATDEPKETLGETLALPPFLEPRRAQIEAGLKPLT
jgi:glyoxalase family protein